MFLWPALAALSAAPLALRFVYTGPKSAPLESVRWKRRARDELEEDMLAMFAMGVVGFFSYQPREKKEFLLAFTTTIWHCTCQQTNLHCVSDARTLHQRTQATIRVWYMRRV
jgi:hypothetical protein